MHQTAIVCRFIRDYMRMEFGRLMEEREGSVPNKWRKEHPGRKHGALLPFCPSALLPFCPSALLPFCPSALPCPALLPFSVAISCCPALPTEARLLLLSALPLP